MIKEFGIIGGPHHGTIPEARGLRPGAIIARPVAKPLPFIMDMDECDAEVEVQYGFYRLCMIHSHGVELLFWVPDSVARDGEVDHILKWALKAKRETE